MAGRWGLGVPCWVGVPVRACQGGVGVRGGGALPAVLGRRGGGLAVEVLRVVLGRRGGLAVVGWKWLACTKSLQCPVSCAPCWGGEVGWRWWGVGAGWRWLVCTNGLQHPSRVLRAVLGQHGGLAVAAYWGRDE
ncbi:hypothetical protein EDB86DRAFT_2832312 [Lactarius hatsudake]|nr:hypothetical protein EDB86DRAFT_2832312 [Lactarius hatsudake]